jgi:hypothetical protein
MNLMLRGATAGQATPISLRFELVTRGGECQWSERGCKPTGTRHLMVMEHRWKGSESYIVMGREMVKKVDPKWNQLMLRRRCTNRSNILGGW